MIRRDIVGFVGLINSISSEGASQKSKKKDVEGNLCSRSEQKKIKVIKNVQEMGNKGRAVDRYMNHEKERYGEFRVSLDSRRKNTLNKLELCPTDTKFSLRSSVQLEPTKAPFRARSNLYENYCEIMQKKHRRRVLKTIASNQSSNHGLSIQLQSPCNLGTTIPSKCNTTAPKTKVLTPIFDFIRIRKSGQIKMKQKTFDGESKKLPVGPTTDNLKSMEQKLSLGLFRKTKQKKVCKTEGNFLSEQFCQSSKKTRLDGWRYDEEKQFIETENF